MAATGRETPGARMLAAQPLAEAIAPALDDGLLQARIRRRLPHFMVVPPILAATDLAVILPLRPAQRFASLHDLQVVEPDLGLPPFTAAMHWTWRSAHDPGHRWLRARAAAMRF